MMGGTVLTCILLTILGGLLAFIFTVSLRTNSMWLVLLAMYAANTVAMPRWGKSRGAFKHPE